MKMNRKTFIFFPNFNSMPALSHFTLHLGQSLTISYPEAEKTNPPLKPTYTLVFGILHAYKIG